MNLLRTFRGRKYLQRTLLSFILVVVLLAIASTLLNANARDKMLRLQNEADLKLLTQINYNIENMNGIVKNLAVSLYNDDELISLKAGGDYKQSLLKIYRLDRTVADSPYLHAIVFYNPTQKRYFSSLNHSMNSDLLYSELSRYTNEHPNVPKLQLIPLDLDGGEGIDVFAFFLYDGPTLGSVNDNVLILTVKPDWMLDNVKALNKLAERENDGLFIADGNGKILISSENAESDVLGMKNALLGRIGESSSTLDDFTYTYEGTKYKVTYLSKGLNNWKIVSVRDYDAVLGGVRQLQATELIVTVSVVLLAVLLSVFFSLRLYKPVGQLYSLVRPDGRELPKANDEMSVIAATYKGMLDKLSTLEQEQASQVNIAKAYQLRSLISGSEGVSEGDLQQLQSQYGLSLAVPGEIVVAVAKLDGLEALVAEQGAQAESLYSFAIANIGQELLGGAYCCEAADMRSGHLVFLVSGAEKAGASAGAGAGTGAGIALAGLKERFAELQRTVGDYYRVSFTVALSRPFSRYREITQHYKQALRHADYRLLLGKGSIIEPEAIAANERNPDYLVPTELERQLTEGLRSGDRGRTEEALARWKAAVGGFRFENIYAAVLHLAMTLSNTLGEMNQYHLNPLSVDLQAVNRRILGAETLDDIAAVLAEVIGETIDRRQAGKEDKSQLIADTIKEIIGRHYADPDLNVQRIADMLKMNPVYLGQTFKAQAGDTVVDCINSTRLSRARQYLEQQDLTVAEIMEKVGFGNESYFYRLFKRRYSVTPKEYRLKFSIDKHT
ncbi:AraC family transcriptional regulator [Cohnella fermenti]|uniref:AraC family transcriptional regulator n=1 Tax=Cohnella fermenti TaxID=2565925 RepID=A0A4S4BN51_9BACL|nr:AraC family transcriptional regulator [Cohnella fermenti]THF76220.1 AraC family transcriptional regulator [Cohnella fermenti]